MKEVLAITTHIGVYNSDACLLIGPEEGVERWARKAMVKRKVEPFLEGFGKASDTLLGRTVYTGGGGCVIWMPKWNEAVFVHEIIHAAIGLFQGKHTPINQDTEEPFAYLVQFLYETLKPPRKKKKPLKKSAPPRNK